MLKQREGGGSIKYNQIAKKQMISRHNCGKVKYSRIYNAIPVKISLV